MKCASCGLELPGVAEPCPACGSRQETHETAIPAAAGATDLPTRARTGRPDVQTATLHPGTMLGARYRILSLAGRGGMGEVYRAEDLELAQTVALKVLPKSLERDEGARARLLDEVRIARQVSHPNVCRVYDIGEAQGRLFISMEWIEGKDLGSILAEDAPLSPDRGLFLARQLCAGVVAAHERGVLHRDLKPANVMVDDRGVARIMDFGLAHAGGEVRGGKAREGTLCYMSPEQLAGGVVSAQSDLYSLGLVLYEIFTGRPVFEASGGGETERQRFHPPARPSSLAPDLDRGIDEAIMGCLEPDPRLRPATARAILELLPGGEASRKAIAAAQQRADRIAAFRAELAELRRAGVIRIDAEDLAAVSRYHDRALHDLVSRFDVDVSERGKQLSLGMRVISFLGAVALAASIFYFFYRIWGVLSTAQQIGVLLGAPVLALLLTSVIAHRPGSRYFTSIAALAAFASLVVDTTLMESIFNRAPSPLPMLAWGVFAMVLAYGYRLRLQLVIGLSLVAASLAGSLHAVAGGMWGNWPQTPEVLFPAAIAILLIALLTERRQPEGFTPVYSLLAIVLLAVPAFLLSLSMSHSFLPLHREATVAGYQILGFLIAAGAIWLGIARRWKEAVYGGACLFMVFLFMKFVDWWWDWMPKYLFFLTLAATSLIVLGILRRLRGALSVRLEGAS